MVHHSKELEQQFALQTAAAMCTAARTAPKGHGKDTIHTLVLTGEDKERLAEKMEEVGKRMMGEKWPTWYGRDANNVRAANAVVLIGAELRRVASPTAGPADLRTAANVPPPAGAAASCSSTSASP